MPLCLRICSLILLLAFAAAARAAPLRLLTTDVQPLAFVVKGKLTGFCVEIVEEIQRRLGEPAAMEVLPWARAYALAQTSQNTLLVCPKRTREREALFQWVGPLLMADTYLYAKAGMATPLHSLADIKKLPNLLVIRESYAFHYLSSKGFENLYLVNNASGMLQMLAANRAPAMVLETVQFDFVMCESGAPKIAIVPLMKLQSVSSNLAFSRDVPVRVVAQWQATFDAMTHDGTYRTIYEKWFPSAAVHQRRQP